ncbi:choline transport protein [Zopfia rhizophila CBS 207.26]|uniref:Choline transport protein n=1 Tax=Zopfia rhizophila CBS 207.26 TaxID=1314779 RepID=A0A6A6E954_9PEZI|nr:choline transport protein [Zopfia rhizophila CBS 207.26]
MAAIIPESVEFKEMANEPRSRGSAETRDRVELARVGKKEVLKRNFAFMSMLGFGCIVLSTWEGVLMLFALAFQNGGPSGLVYGFIITWIGTLSIFITLSELASMAPTSGGQYYWCAMLGPRKYRKVLSYMTGWLTVCGWQGALISAFILSGSMIQSLAALNNPSYNPKNWQALLIMYTCIVLAALFNTAVSSFLPAIEGLILITHIAGFFAILIPVVYLAPVHNSPKEVFDLFMNEGGWPTQGLSFFLGTISTVFIFLGADSVIHMSEEIRNASRVVPWATISSVLVNGLLGFGMILGVLFSLGNDLKGVLKTPYGYPFIQIFMNSTRSTAATTALASLLLALIFFSTIGLVASTSRMIWSFARDRGLPGWRVLSKVDPRSSIPVASILTTCIISLLLLLIYLGSPLVLSDMISLTINSFYGSYFISAAILLYRRLRGQIKERGSGDHCPSISLPHDANHTVTITGAGTDQAGNEFNLTWGPWRVRGWLGTLNNIFACTWMLLALFFSSWPTTKEVDGQTMNYSIFITVFVVAASAVYYFVWARREGGYIGPVIEVRVQN